MGNHVCDFLFSHGCVCSCVSWPGQRASEVIVCLFTQQEIPLPFHPLITPAARQILLLTHTHAHTHTDSATDQRHSFHLQIALL